MARREKERLARLMLKRLKIAAQGLPGVAGETIHDVLAQKAERPMRGQARDMQHDGLFGDGHKQIGLF